MSDHDVRPENIVIQANFVTPLLPLCYRERTLDCSKEGHRSMRKKLTDRAIAALTPPTLGRLELFDLIFPGFGVRVTANGRKTFMLMYRIAGRLRRLTLGRYPALTLAKAREKAGRALSLVERGSDPADEEMVRRAAGAESLGDVLAEYFATHAMRALRSAAETRRLIER